MKYDLRLTDRSSFQAIAATADFAERHGIVTLWSADTIHDPFLALAAAARDTRRVKLGTGIAVAFGRSPVVTALMSWDLQRLSGGRFVLGLGTQIKAHVERRFGMHWHGAATQMREYVACLRNIWSHWQRGESPSYRGQIYRCDLSNPEFQPVPLPEAQARIPIWIGAVGLGMARLAGEIADGVHVHAFHTPEYLRAQFLPALAAGRGHSGGLGPLELSCPVFGGVAYDGEQRRILRDEFRKHIAFYASTAAYLPILEAAGCADLHEPMRALSREKRWAEMAARIGDDVLDAFVVIDEPAALGARLRERYSGILTQLSLYRGAERFIKPQDWPALIEALA
ncbi:MAG: TIGR03617 family F420-dependent LLM class oxidoreductase [Gammaproteobacteria bacterium]